jgi:hypothetical protein
MTANYLRGASGTFCVTWRTFKLTFHYYRYFACRYYPFTEVNRHQYGTGQQPPFYNSSQCVVNSSITAALLYKTKILAGKLFSNKKLTIQTNVDHWWSTWTFTRSRENSHEIDITGVFNIVSQINWKRLKSDNTENLGALHGTKVNSATLPNSCKTEWYQLLTTNTQSNPHYLGPYSPDNWVSKFNINQSIVTWKIYLVSIENSFSNSH